MNLEQRVHALTGSLILIGIGLTFLASIFFLVVPVLVAADLLQSAFSGVCVAEKFLGTLGTPSHLAAPSAHS
jgi:hypothetical protein